VSVGRSQFTRRCDDNPWARRSGWETVGRNVRIALNRQIVCRSADVDKLDQLTLTRKHLVFGRRTLRTVTRRDSLVSMVRDEVAVAAVRYLRPALARKQVERINERYGNENDGKYRQDELKPTSLIHNRIWCFSAPETRVGKFAAGSVVPVKTANFEGTPTYLSRPCQSFYSSRLNPVANFQRCRLPLDPSWYCCL